jgi:hypothetical protein
MSIKWEIFKNWCKKALKNRRKKINDQTKDNLYGKLLIIKLN